MGRSVGKTLVTRTTGTKIASDGLKGRVFEVSLADLQRNESDAFRKMRLRVEEVQGKNCLTNFWGMDFTTADGYVLRMFCIGFTKKRDQQIKRTCYAQSSQIRQIRKKMVELMTREAAACDLKELVGKFIPEVIGKEIEKACQGIYPLQNTFIRKVKILRAPKFDITKLMEVHGDFTEESGSKLDRPDEAAAPAEPIVGAE